MMARTIESNSVDGLQEDTGQDTTAAYEPSNKDDCNKGLEKSSILESLVNSIIREEDGTGEGEPDCGVFQYGASGTESEELQQSEDDVTGNTRVTPEVGTERSDQLSNNMVMDNNVVEPQLNSQQTLPYPAQPCFATSLLIPVTFLFSAPTLPLSQLNNEEKEALKQLEDSTNQFSNDHRISEGSFYYAQMETTQVLSSQAVTANTQDELTRTHAMELGIILPVPNALNFTPSISHIGNEILQLGSAVSRSEHSTSESVTESSLTTEDPVKLLQERSMEGFKGNVSTIGSEQLEPEFTALGPRNTEQTNRISGRSTPLENREADDVSTTRFELSTAGSQTSPEVLDLSSAPSINASNVNDNLPVNLRANARHTAVLEQTENITTDTTANVSDTLGLPQTRCLEKKFESLLKLLHSDSAPARDLNLARSNSTESRRKSSFTEVTGDSSNTNVSEVMGNRSIATEVHPVPSAACTLKERSLPPKKRLFSNSESCTAVEHTEQLLSFTLTKQRDEEQLSAQHIDPATADGNEDTDDDVVFLYSCLPRRNDQLQPERLVKKLPPKNRLFENDESGSTKENAAARNLQFPESTSSHDQVDTVLDPQYSDISSPEEPDIVEIPIPADKALDLTVSLHNSKLRSSHQERTLLGASVTPECAPSVMDLRTRKTSHPRSAYDGNDQERTARKQNHTSSVATIQQLDTTDKIGGHALGHSLQPYAQVRSHDTPIPQRASAAYSEASTRTFVKASVTTDTKKQSAAPNPPAISPEKSAISSPSYGPSLVQQPSFQQAPELLSEEQGPSRRRRKNPFPKQRREARGLIPEQSEQSVAGLVIDPEMSTGGATGDWATVSDAGPSPTASSTCPASQSNIFWSGWDFDNLHIDAYGPSSGGLHTQTQPLIGRLVHPGSEIPASRQSVLHRRAARADREIVSPPLRRSCHVSGGNVLVNEVRRQYALLNCSQAETRKETAAGSASGKSYHKEKSLPSRTDSTQAIQITKNVRKRKHPQEETAPNAQRGISVPHFQGLQYSASNPYQQPAASSDVNRTADIEAQRFLGNISPRVPRFIRGEMNRARQYLNAPVFEQQHPLLQNALFHEGNMHLQQLALLQPQLFEEWAYRELYHQAILSRTNAFNAGPTLEQFRSQTSPLLPSRPQGARTYTAKRGCKRGQ